MYQCSKCGLTGCTKGDLSKTLPECPSLDRKEQEEIGRLYQEKENHDIAYHAAVVEAEGYGRKTRIEEILDFIGRMQYKKIGLVFCMGLRKEALEVQKILENHGLTVVSVTCKNGAFPKSSIGLRDEETVSGCSGEIMCNPIGQAFFMNREKTEFNIILGLCVGHDTLALKYLEAPVTILAVKDRVTGHNPLAPIYLAQGYYHDKLYR